MNEEVQDAAEDAMDAIAKHYDRETLLLSTRMPPMNTGQAELADYLEDLRFGDADTRKKAADKLDDYPGTQAVAALVNILINDDNDDVREEAAKTLGKLGDRMARAIRSPSFPRVFAASSRTSSLSSLMRIFTRAATACVPG